MPTLAPDTPRLEPDDGFVVATGIECSAPVVGRGVRQDELRKTGHWERFEEDFALIRASNIRFVRYGVPFHVVAAGPRARDFDWQWTDRAMGSLRDHGLEPILDLFHFGLPDDIGAVGDPILVERFEAYAREVAERYPWVRYYTPVNEPLVTAVMSARAGVWNERARDDRAFVAALDSVATCAVRGMEIIRQRRPDAVFLQSDACEQYTALDAAADGHAAFLNERRFVGYDLTYGMPPEPSVVAWLLVNGMGEDRLEWFREHGSREGCIVGHDYYRGNEWLVEAGGRTRRAGTRRRGYAALAREYHARYQMPFLLSETNIAGALAPGWLAEVWNDALRLREEGLPIRGFCWYGFVDHVDWDSGLARNRGRVNHCGLVGLDRHPHPVAHQYSRLAEDALSGRYQPIRRRRADRRLRPAA
jgi:beta-glucosidase/6-phospho-beta-glucosidase/beta-galactosidase